MDAPVVRVTREGERHLDVLKWGLIPYFTKDLKKARKPINVRDDNVAKWPDYPDESRFKRFLRGYDEVMLLSQAEIATIPFLMIEALIAEAVFPSEKAVAS